MTAACRSCSSNGKGCTYFFRPKVTVLRTPDGELYGVLLLMQDITQFKELDRLKSDFIATVSHEFRTPVTSINMSVDILDQQLLGPLTSKQKELVTSAKEDCYRLTKLARELLQLSKLESGRVQVRDEPLNMHDVVEATVASVAHPVPGEEGHPGGRCAGVRCRRSWRTSSSCPGS